MRLTIKTRLCLLLLIPLLGISYLGVQGLLRASKTASQMGHLNTLSGLAVRIGALVHETQKERGRTAGFLGSKGAKFKAELPAQRNDTDKHIAELKNFLADFDATRYGQDFQQALTGASNDLTHIKDIRRQVSDLSIPAADAIGYYTTMNGRFLDAVGTMTKQSSDANLAIMINAYVSFLKGKERAGIERAVMASTFASDKFAPGLYPRFISLVTQQDTYIAEFLHSATDDAVNFYQKTMQDNAVAQVQQYRDIASAKASEGQFGVEAGVWFDAITAKINLLKQTEDWLADQLASSAAQAKSTAVGQQIFVASLMAAIIGISIIGGIVVIRSIIKPINATVERLKDIAQGDGDLTKRVDQNSKDELGELGRWFNTFIQKVHDLIAQVSAVTHDVAGAANEIAASSEEMSQGMNEQTQQMTQISTAIEEMSASVVEVASKSVDAAKRSEDSGTMAQEGGEVVNQTICGMNAISDAVNSSALAVTELGKRGEQIGQIIRVINDIADQTNLLALNAAIEAARAGEHGRGFAVVADEVRKLADRTTQATDEIGASITAIQTETQQAVERMSAGTEQVQEGVTKATAAGQSLEQIVEAAKDVASMIQSIAATSEQQSSASEEVSSSIQSIAAVCQESSQSSRQVAEGASTLFTKADQLQKLVGQFKIQEAAKVA